MLGVFLSPSQQYLLRHDLTLNVETHLLDWSEEPQVISACVPPTDGVTQVLSLP